MPGDAEVADLRTKLGGPLLCLFVCLFVCLFKISYMPNVGLELVLTTEIWGPLLYRLSQPGAPENHHFRLMF